MAKKAVIKISGDTKEAQTALQKVTAEVNKLTKGIKTTDIVKFTASFNALKGAVNLGSKAIKAAVSEVKELEEAYKTQITAEKQLEVAAKNNPYLNQDSVRQLEDYASHLQSISTVGDETLLPMMAQLASAGRTQTEIQDIMAAALDISASGMMSLDSAVTALNKTFSGTAGQIGNQITKIKSLTAEQLKNGEAVKIIREQFKGMAEETALATGSSEQLKNAIGDVKEELGAVFEESAKPMRRFFTEAFSNISSLLSQLRKARENAETAKIALEHIQAGTATLEDFEIAESGTEQLIEKNLNKIDELQAKYDSLSARRQNGALGKKYKDEIAELEAQNDRFITSIEYFNTEITKKQTEELQTLVENAKNTDSLAAKQSILTQAQAYETKLKNSKEYKRAIVEIQNDITSTEIKSEMDAAIAAQEAYEQKIQNYKDEIAKRKELGETLTDEEIILGEIQIRQQGLFDLVEKYSMLDWDTADVQEYAEEIQKLYTLIKQKSDNKETVDKDSEEKLKKLKSDAENLISQANNFVGSKESLLSTQINDEITVLDAYMETLDKTGQAYEELAQKKKALEELVDAVRVQELTNQIAQNIETVTSYVDKFAEITNGITELVRDNNEQETEEAMAALSEQYTNGIISYEEYCEKKAELDKKAAQEEYKLKMWEWTASLLQATANVAQGIAKALAEGGPYAGPILAALIGASGAVQIATITANKPKAPSFATGGIVQGSSYSGDKVHANVNSGEMILTEQQQANLWKMANGASGSGAVINMPVNIENNADASVKTQLSADGLRIMINKIVNSEMAAGVYTQSMNIAQGRAQGASYL